GTVVADYFGVAFLHLLHRVAADLGEAAGQALRAGVDVELPTGDAYLAPLAAAVRSGAVEEPLVDRACTRVLEQKAELGLLGATFKDEPPAHVELDGPEHRAAARQLAEESVVLLSNDGTPPLAAPGRVAGVGPGAGRHRRHAAAGRAGPGRRRRYERRPAGGAVRLLLVRQPRHPATPRDRSRHRRSDGA